MTPRFTSTYTGRSGRTYLYEWFDADSIDGIPREQITQAYAVAFHGNGFLVVNNVKKPGNYSLIGGSVEPGEHPDETLVREIKEEANMKVLSYKLLGYQKVTDMSGIDPVCYQLRYVARVEPYGPFVADPAGSVTEIITCTKDNYKQYFDWGEIGDWVVGRAYINFDM